MISTPDEWQAKLGEMQYIINNSYHSAIKSSPSKVLLRYECRNRDDFSFNQFVNHFSDETIDSEIERTENRNLAKQASDLVRRYNKVYTNSHSKKLVMYKEGDYVLVRDTRIKPGINAKFKSNYKDPYLIQKVLGNNRYMIIDIPGFNDISPNEHYFILSSDRLKYWIKPIE